MTLGEQRKVPFLSHLDNKLIDEEGSIVLPKSAVTTQSRNTEGTRETVMKLAERNIAPVLDRVLEVPADVVVEGQHAPIVAIAEEDLEPVIHQIDPVSTTNMTANY